MKRLLKFVRCDRLPLAIALLPAFLSVTVANPPAIATIPTLSQSPPAPRLAQVNPDQLYQQGWDAYQNQNFEQAVGLWQQSLDQYQAAQNSTGARTAREALGAVYLKLRQYDQVIAHLRPLLDVPAEDTNWQGQAAAWSNLALAHRMTGNYVEALSVQQQVLSLRRTHQDALGEAEALINLGQIYQVLGNYVTADANYQQSLNLIRGIQNRPAESILLASLGALNADQGNYAEALGYYQDSQAIATSLNDLRGQAYALTNLGATYFSYQRNYEAALQHWSQALSLAEQIPDLWLAAKNASHLGLAHEKLQQFETALGFHNRSSELFQQVGSKPDIAMTLNNKAHTLLEWGKALRTSGAPTDATARFQQAATDLNAAIALLDSIRSTLSTDAEQVSVFDTQAMTYNLLQQVLVEQDQEEAALQASEQGRSRAFTTLLTEKQQLDPEAISLNQLQSIARRQKATLVEYSLVPDNEFVHQGKLRGTTAEIYIWVVQPNGTVHFRRSPIDPQHRLEDLVKTAHSAIGQRSRGGFVTAEVIPSEATENLKVLHQLLIAPIQDLLPATPEDQVVFVPQGDLFLVPFPALIDSSGNYLIQHHTVLSAPSIQVLALTQQQENRMRRDRSLTAEDMLIVGNPIMPEVWDAQSGQTKPLSPLAGAHQEATRIASFFNTQALTGADALEGTVKQRAGTARLIHLATHGLLEYGNPQNSGVSDVPGAIALTPDSDEDGLLTSAEILNLDLNAELVVLSACDTGLGDITGDGVIGLSRSLIAAGVSSVVVSLWSVPDAPTADLMTEFYRQIQQGQDKAQALRQAMLTTMATHPNPTDWAAFTLIGAAE
ncbi:CHAT domain-containing protein [Nodosilinea sp. LEGE 06152]|uniref:CHAT domain-containing protein n=1 Tax=Nodosilinea sp. LEGE 06152 TaxID=2777966 RepID=UPI0018830A98|nr:CHAT domain-containing tetratricopeptide repeat protein [Nodosilinea sp. LEGE 06152]MBE9158220.1 CHAT domain-containing protein [Nodosilinea sp. LEGE 06152]MBE9160628.1 CHAT domain-containing protein [Nodosilinea sp. LEGE 06152]